MKLRKPATGVTITIIIIIMAVGLHVQSEHLKSNPPCDSCWYYANFCI